MLGSHHFQPGSRAWIVILLRWAGAGAVIALLLHFLPVHLLRAAVVKVPPWRFLALLGGYLLAHVVGVFKWRMVVNAAGAGLDFATSAQCYFGGLFGTLFLPSIVGGDAVRLVVGLRRSPNPAAVLAGNLADRFLDLMAQVGLVALALALLTESELVPRKMEGRFPRLFWGIAGLAVLLIALAFVIGKKLFKGRSVRFRRRLARLRRAVRLVSKRPGVLALGWALGTFVQTVFLFLTAQLAVYCGLVLPLRVWFFAWPLAKLAAMLPITQGGIGIREAALVTLLAPFGAQKHLVLAAGLLWEGIVIAGGLIAGGLALLLRLGREQVQPDSN